MNTFFEEMTNQSEVKSELVQKYFKAWATIMNKKSRSDRLGYIDLFSGPGRYEDDSISTPLKVLEYIISEPALRNKMVTIFNDADPHHADTLKKEIEKLEGINTLKYKPKVNNSAVGEEITEMFSKKSMVPIFAFVDPWGYKGLSSKLIHALIKDWGSDCIFFFNYNRISMGITNHKIKQHIDDLFGESRADNLRRVLPTIKDPEEKEMLILNELSEALSFDRKNFVLPFKFISGKNKGRTTHHLIFVSKHQLGYTIMKNIMSSSSSENNDGVASFSYINVQNRQLKLLFDYSQTVDGLAEKLLTKFSGKTMLVREIHDHDHIGTNFVMGNYQEALRRLEEQNKISVHPPAADRRLYKGKKTMNPDKTSITFP